MMTFIRNALKALVVSALAVGVTDAALAAPFILTDAVEGGAPAARTERVRQRYAEDADLIFGLAYHVQPRGAFGKAARGARQARQYKFAASFPTVQPSQLWCVPVGTGTVPQGKDEDVRPSFRFEGVDRRSFEVEWSFAGRRMAG